MSTLRDVAEAAGVDVSTVSRVLREDPAQVARPETRARIVAAARRLGYRPNALARSLRTRRTNVIALVTPGIDNIGFTDVIHGVQQAASERRTLVLLADAEALHHDEDLYARLVLEGRIDGLLAAFGSVRDPLVRSLASHDVPVVAVNREVKGVAAAVIADDDAGSRLAVDHLVALGHRGIAHIGGPPELDTSRRRSLAFRRAMAERGLRVPRHWVVDGGYTESGGRQAAASVLAGPGRRPTALFAANLTSALGALSAVKDASLRVPEEVSIVTMDEHPVAAHTDPPLSTISMPLAAMGAEAVGLLLELADGAVPRRVMISTPPRLVPRGSTAPAPDHPS